METRNMRRKASEKQPLPGERRGTFGATAGGDSMRAGGDQELNRRALIGDNPEYTTAEHSSTHPSPLIAAPAASASQRSNLLLPETTAAGRQRRRMKWTIEINTFIMREYYTITKMETDTTAYRQKLHQRFLHRFPDSEVSEQRIADQRRAIVQKNLLSAPVLEAIKEEVRNMLNSSEPSNLRAVEISAVQTHDDNGTSMSESMDDKSREEVQIRNEFAVALAEFEGTDPLNRYLIPRQNCSKKLARAISVLNEKVLPQHLQQRPSFEEIHTAIYCAAVVASRCNGSKLFSRVATAHNDRSEKRMPPWERRLVNRIESTRRDIGRLTQFKNGNTSEKLRRKVNNILINTKIHTKHEPLNSTITEHLDTLRQKLLALTKRLRRYRNCTTRKQQNSLFNRNQKAFYRNMSKGKGLVNDMEESKLPSKAQIEDFWKPIWSSAVSHNPDRTWIEKEYDRHRDIPLMGEPIITVEIVQAALNKAHNWKAPGSDGLHNYWLKKFTSTHHHIANIIQYFLHNPENLPYFLTEGRTFLLPKGGDTKDPSKYRPITCLQTFYKLITSCVSQMMMTHIEEQNILANEQKGCRPGSQGCKEQLIIDSVIMGQVLEKQRNLYACYIDYAKAFDTVPHSWLLQCLDVYKVHPFIQNFLKTAMSRWNTKLYLSNGKQSVHTDTIHICRGIFQGDSLSPLLFCLALNPLSTLLNSSNYGIALKKGNSTLLRVSHLLYMDDLKLYADTESHMRQLINVTEKFTDDIKMKFGLDKCRRVNIIRGHMQVINLETDNEPKITFMEPHETYKYLGFQQSLRIKHTVTKNILTTEVCKRLHGLLKTQLSARNLVQAINSFVIPVLTYSFGVIKWSNTDLDNLQRTIRTAMTQHRKHHPHSSTERFTLPRAQGGRGIVDLINLHSSQIASLRRYFLEHCGTVQQAVSAVDNNYSPLNLKKLDTPVQPIIETEEKITLWKAKALHGRYPHELSKPEVDISASHAWLQHGDLFPETEAFMIAIQDQVVPTLNYRKHILRDSTIHSDSCRRCEAASETIQHVTSGCSSHAQVEYKKRHDEVAKQVHQLLALRTGLLATSVPYYKYVPQNVLESSEYTLYWDRSIITDRHVGGNRPDITYIDRNQQQVFLIDISIPNTHNISGKYQEKIQKYADLAYEVATQWNFSKVTTVPIIISATGVIPKMTLRALECLHLDTRNVYNMQKTVILNTCRIVRSHLNLQ